MGRELAVDHAQVRVRVPAKLNLFLAVRGLRDDGYHELVTVMQTVALFDEVRAEVIAPSGRGHHPTARRRMRLELLNEPVPGVPSDESNMALRAARALAQTAGFGDRAGERAEDGARTVIDLRKRIPVAGGMAGGSADAAAALVALNELWGLSLTRDQLRELGAGLGSDVPFCVVGGTALATGRGTAVAQVLSRGTFHWVICQSAAPLPTAAVYRAWDTHCSASEIEPDAVLHALRCQDAEALGAALHNDLEDAAFALRPELREAKSALRAAGALGAVLSGSGPTLLALAGSHDDARRLAHHVDGQFDKVTIAHSPAGGPELERP